MGNIRQSGVGIPWQLPAADHSVACWTNKAPENGVWMQRSQKLNTFCYVTSSFDLDFMHACHDYIIYGHGEPISQIMWIMTRRCLISAVVGCMLLGGCTLCILTYSFLVSWDTECTGPNFNQFIVTSQKWNSVHIYCGSRRYCVNLCHFRWPWMAFRGSSGKCKTRLGKYTMLCP